MRTFSGEEQSCTLWIRWDPFRASRRPCLAGEWRPCLKRLRRKSERRQSGSSKDLVSPRTTSLVPNGLLRSLKANDSITILLADKDNAAVVPGTSDYKKKIATLLQDKAYGKLKKDPTESIECKCKHFVSDHLQPRLLSFPPPPNPSVSSILNSILASFLTRYFFAACVGC
jgi:hypothetical protein